MDVSEVLLHNILADSRRECFTTHHVLMPGQIVNYDSSSGLAVVQPMLRRKNLSGEIMTAPVLSGVPVLLLSADHEI